MKLNILLGLLVVVLAYVTCQNFKKTAVAAPGPVAAPAPLPEPEGQLPWKSSHVIQGDNPSSAYTYQVQAAPKHVDVPWDKVKTPTTSRRVFMASGWWYPQMAYQPSDSTVHVNYLGKWFRFHEDQTFEIYFNGKVIDNGHWAYDDPNAVMYISCNDPYFNNTWAVQERGFRMVWKGNTELNVTGIQVRMDNAATPPWLK